MELGKAANDLVRRAPARTESYLLSRRSRAYLLSVLGQFFGQDTGDPRHGSLFIDVSGPLNTLCCSWKNVLPGAGQFTCVGYKCGLTLVSPHRSLSLRSLLPVPLRSEEPSHLLWDPHNTCFPGSFTAQP